MADRKNQNRTAKSKTRVIQGVLLVLLALILAVVLVRCSSTRKERASIKKGIDYLHSIDSEEELAATEKVIKEQRAAAITQLLAGEGESEDGFDPWGYFSDSVILGDSRSVGFYLFDYLPQERVMAEPGNTIQTIDGYMDAIKSINPSYIFLCYGLNDVTSGRWDSAEAWISEYREEVKKLHEQFPDTTVVINSILPVVEEKAVSTNERVKLVPEYAAALQQFCETDHILYVNCDETAAEHQDMVDVDGIHYMTTFYPYWAGEMIMTAYIDNEGGED